MNRAAWAERNGVARSARSGQRRKFLAVLGDPSVHRILVEHRDRFGRFGSESMGAALAAQDRELGVADAAEVDEDLVRDMKQVLGQRGQRVDHG